MKKNRKIRSSWGKGILAESIAALYLLFKGYRILTWRYKTRSGEIDIIAKRGDRIAIIEVKTRANLEKALGALTSNQKKRIINTSKYWISKNTYYRKFTIRYDYIILNPWRLPLHLRDFFRE